jgi:FKBP-type peptidyl-prolyl cis-trans isomerase
MSPQLSRLLATSLILALAGCGPKEPAAPVAPEKSAAELQREEFFGAPVANDPAVSWRSSGLGIKILTPGEGAALQMADLVRFHYTGRLKDGTVFDDTRAKGRPADFVINRMLPGMAAGMLALKPGGKAVFYVPPSLGYGGQRFGKIPPVSPLVFEVELLAVNPEP